MFLENTIKVSTIDNGINVHTLKAGTLILVITKNSLYKIIKGNKDKYDITIQGGKRLPEVVTGYFTGSTFGGSIIKLGWIGYMMSMEVYIPTINKTLVTSGVREVKIVGHGWEYDMEWTKKQ